jgi:hypothetical protein
MEGAMKTNTKEIKWLKQFVGEWKVDVEAFCEPGKPSRKVEGTERVRAIGDCWVVCDSQSLFMGEPFAGIFTLGFDADRKKFVATWICCMDSHLWTYEGKLDKAGKVLTLAAEGPCPDTGETVKVRDTLEFKGKDQRVMTIKMQRDGGKWVTGMIIVASRDRAPGSGLKGETS